MSSAKDIRHKRAYKLRLYPKRAQEAALMRWCDAGRWAWNVCLDWRECLYRRSHAKVSGQYWFAKVVSRWRASGEYPWLENVPADVFAKKLEDQDRAFTNFYAGRGQYPNLKTKRNRQSVRVNLDHRHRQKTIAWTGGHIVAPKLGKLRVRGRALPTTMAKQLTFARETTGAWYVSFAVEDTIEQWTEPVNRVSGIDLGVKDAAIIATDEVVETVPNPRLHDRFKAREKALHQRLARQKKGSSRRARTLRTLARLKQRQANCRVDHLHKLTSRIVRESQTIAIEDLNVRGMTTSAKGTPDNPGRNVRQKAGLNREILAVAFGEFRRQIEYKAKWHGRSVCIVARFVPTSKACSVCAAVKSDLMLTDREWQCAHCGTRHDRDENAARNIRALGERQHREERGKCAALA